MPRSSIRCDTVGTVSDFVLVGTVSDFVLVGTVSDFVLGSYVPFSKPKTKSDTAHFKNADYRGGVTCLSDFARGVLAAKNPGFLDISRHFTVHLNSTRMPSSARGSNG